MSHHPPRAAHAGLFAAVILALALCGLHVRLATGQGPDIQYRRVTVPHDAMESQIRGLLPLQRDEFERRLRLATGPATPRTNPAAVRIDQARFTAQLAGGQLQGTAELAIVSAAAEPSLLTLQPCNVAVSAAAWREPGARSAVLGIDHEGQLRCVVPQSGTLHWNWTAPAAETRPQQTTFALRLPAAPRRTLEVAAPADCEIAVKEGIVVAPPVASGGETIRRWMIELSGSPEVRLFVRPVQKAHNARPLVIVRESSNYSVLPATIDLEATFLLDFPALPATRLDLIAGAGLRVTGIQLDGERLNFSSSAAAAAEATSIEVELPREIFGWRRTLQVTATADWPPASRWMLPRVAVAEGVLQEGSATIAAPTWLRLQARASAGCVLSAVTPASAGRASDQFQFQIYDADGSIEIAADQSPAPLREESGTQIAVDATQIKSVLIADLSTFGGDSFTVEATVPRHWIVDSVETQPPEALADRVLAPRGPAQQLLRLNLTRPVNASRHVQLIVRAHTRRPANGQRLPDGFFSLARFLGVRESRRLVAVQIDQPDAELTLATDRGLARLDPRQLTATDLQLFETPPGGLLVELNDADTAIEGTFTATTARYQADAVVAVRAEETSLRQHVSIRCQPDASAVNSVLVRLAPRPTGPVAWRLEGDPQPELTARIESPGVEAGGATSEAILYRVILPRARSSAFEITGEWSSDEGPTGAISLAWLPEANVQTGIVELHGASPAGFVVAADEVQALPIPPTSDNSFSTLRARYRYDASRRARIAVHPAPSGTTQRGAWISALQVTSYFADSGHAQHEATLTVENAGLRQVQVRFERTVSDLRLVDDAGVETPRASATAAGIYSLPLPADSRTAKLRLRYSAPARSAKPWLYGTFSAPVPALDLPVLIREWQVGLPPGLSAFARRDAPHGDQWLSPTKETTSSASIWKAIAEPAWGRKLLTNNQPMAEAIDPAFAGWTIVRAELPTGPAATIRVYRAAVVRAWSLCLALVAAAATAMIAPRGLWLGRTAALLVAAALFVSPPIAWPLAGVCSGLLLGGWFAFWRRSNRGGLSGMVATAPASTLLAPAAGAAGLLLLLALPAAELLGAPHDNPVASGAKRPRVVIPVDDDQQPVGDYVYLEPAFYEALHRLSESSPAALTPWLIASATYDFPDVPRANEAAAVVDEFRAVYEFHTFVPSAMMRLPLARDQIVLREGQARLDGQAASLDWQPDGKALTLPVAAPGKHRLELSLGALARRTPAALVLELSLPRAPQSMVSLPAGEEAVVESAAGSFPVTARTPTSVTLAATDRLSIRWPSSGGDSAAAGLLADQFLWWKIRPGSVVLEGKFRLQPIGGDTREAIIAVDPRLRLLPGALTAGRITIEEGPQQQVKVQLAEPASGAVELRLSWLWPDVTGLGTLHLPQVQVRADRLERQWTAISALDGLQVEMPAGPASIAPAEFLQIWGESTASPGIAWGARAEEQPLPIIVRPENRLPRVEQAIDWSLSASAAAAHVAMQLTQVPESRFEHRLAMPPQWKVASVKLIQEGKAAALRWGQQPDGLLVVTLLEPPGREQELLVSAETALASQRQRFPLATTRLIDAELESSVMRIYRQTDVGVELQSPAGWTEQDDPEIGKHRAGLGRLVAKLRNEAAIGDTQPVVSRWPNRPRVTGVEFIRAHEDDGDWRADVELSLQVTDGVVDELRLAIPDQWSGPLELEPPLEHSVEDLPGARRRLTIRPARAVADRLQLSIRGPLQSGEAGLAAPDVRLLDAPAVERLVLLDRGRSGQQIDWETTGLVAAEAGSILFPAQWHGVTGELLRVVAPRFDARARPRQEMEPAPRGHLAEVQITLNATGRLAAVSRNTIRPAGARTVEWIMPPDCRLVQALVDGAAVTCTSRGPRTWELTAPSPVLPFELTIVYDGAVAPSQRRQSLIRLAAPRLVGVQVEQTLWQIDAGERPLTMLADAVVATASPREAAVMRLEAAARGLEDAAAARSSDVLNSVLSQSEARWLAIYNDALSRLPAADTIDGASERLLSAREDAAQAIARRARQRLSVTEAVANAQSPFAVAAINDAPAGSLWFSAAGPADELALSVVAPASDKLDVTSLLAFILVGLAAALGPLSRVRPVGDWLSAHAHLVLAIAGIAWWLIAPLGWLGWLLVAAGLARSLRFPEARRAQQARWSSSRSRADAA